MRTAKTGKQLELGFKGNRLQHCTAKFGKGFIVIAESGLMIRCRTPSFIEGVVL
jgi:hypothetical protein